MSYIYPIPSHPITSHTSSIPIPWLNQFLIFWSSYDCAPSWPMDPAILRSECVPRNLVESSGIQEWNSPEQWNSLELWIESRIQFANLSELSSWATTSLAIPYPQLSWQNPEICEKIRVVIFWAGKTNKHVWYLLFNTHGEICIFFLRNRWWKNQWPDRKIFLLGC